ncbi:MAG: hypothetical protein FJ291_29215 [Planctomycetes bacterium]|nr:hypothetical protein [Planctomycetota bacterium]
MAKNPTSKISKKPKHPVVRMAIAWGILLAVVGGVVAVLWWVVGPRSLGIISSRDRGRDRAQEEAPRVALFYSCGLEGRLAPYVCEEGALGGVARMASVFSAWAKDQPYRITVDAGNSTLSGHPAADTINTFAWNALERLGYDVVNCGDNEATLSLEELRKFSKDRKFKIISANLVRADTRAPVFPTHHIMRRRGYNVAFIGLLREDILPKHTGKGVRLIGPADALRGALNLVKGKADIIVVLAFLPPEEIYALAWSHPEVNVFLGGLAPASSAPYEIAGPRVNPASLVSYLGDQGCTVTMLDASFPKGRPPAAASQTSLLDSSVPADPAFAGLISEFTAALSGKPLPGAGQDPKMPCTSSYTGSVACQLCHRDEYVKWQATRHAGAYVTLLDKGKQKDPACLACHVTGYGQPGGYDPVRAATPPPVAGKEAPLAVKGPGKDHPLKGVGCEACHGGARRHWGIAIRDRFATARTPFLRPKPSLENCIRCHTAARPCLEPGATERYERNEYMDKIKHWK